jgi:hypothetical protein
VARRRSFALLRRQEAAQEPHNPSGRLLSEVEKGEAGLGCVRDKGRTPCEILPNIQVEEPIAAQQRDKMLAVGIA